MSTRYPLPAAERADLVRRLQSRSEVCDVDFDRVYPTWARRLSDMHWTPVEVARRAAALLCTSHRSRILDVGAGVGKFCIIGALTTRATFIGVEQRPTFVQTATDLAQQLGARRVWFQQGSAFDLDWQSFDGIYLFNPFFEHLSMEPEELMVDAIELSPARFHQDVDRTIEKLSHVADGTRVVLYHGFGGLLPDDFHLIHREQVRESYMELYVKGMLDRTPRSATHPSQRTLGGTATAGENAPQLRRSNMACMRGAPVASFPIPCPQASGSPPTKQRPCLSLAHA